MSDREIQVRHHERDGQRYATPSEPVEQVREASFAPDSLDEEARTVDLVWTTGARVKRSGFFRDAWFEELSLDKGAVRLDRLNSGAPFLNSHRGGDIADVIGVVVDGSARIKDGEGTATVRFSTDPDADRIFQKVKEGIVRNISVGYAVHEWQITERDGAPDEMLATDWEPHELSAVPIPADAGAQVRAANVSAPEPTEDPMSDKNTPPAGGESGDGNVINLDEHDAKKRREWDAENEAFRAATDDSIRILFRNDDEGAEKARERVTALDAGFRASTTPRRATADEVRSALMTLKEERDVSANIDNGHGARTGRVDAGVDQRDKLCDAAEAAILHRLSPRYHKQDSDNPFAGQSMMRIGEGLLSDHDRRKLRGASSIRSAQLICGLDTRSGPLSSSDFPFLLANSIGKRLRATYDKGERTFLDFVSMRDLPDFKTVDSIAMGELEAVEVVKEGEEYPTLSFGEDREQWKLDKRGGIISITWELLVNDDLSGMNRRAELLANSALRAENAFAWGLITGNQVMADSIACFHSSHSNLGTPGVLSATTLGELRGLLRSQTGLTTAVKLRLRPFRLLLASSLVDSWEQLISPNYTPTGSATVTPGWIRNLEVIDEPLLDDISPKAFYLVVDPSVFTWFEFGHLVGEGGPVLERQQGFEIDGFDMKVRDVFGGRIVDYRGGVKNANV
jgi:HK97 family phage prohead protease